MLTGYRWATGIVVALFLLTLTASYYGWGLSSDAEAMARARSVRTGSLHTRTFFGGGGK